MLRTGINAVLAAAVLLWIAFDDAPLLSPQNLLLLLVSLLLVLASQKPRSKLRRS